VFAGTSAPGGLAVGTLYYIVNNTGSTFQLSATSAGAAIDITSASGTYDLTSGGHVENAADSAHNGTDADVSGTAKITGTVFDGTDVSSLTVEISSNDGTSYTTFPAVLSNKTGDAVFGYTYNWTFTWDTAKQGMAPVAKDNTIVRAYGTDPGSNQLVEGSRPTRTVDVIPYVTGLEKSAKALARTRLGKYPLIEGDTGIIVKGFNINGATGTSGLVTVRNSGGTQTLNLNVTAVDTTNFTSATVSIPATAYSGHLYVTTSSVDCGNNVNNNTLSQNSEAIVNQDATTLWNDDRYVQMWTAGLYFAHGGTEEYPLSPAMDINPSNNELAGAWIYQSTPSMYFQETNSPVSGNYLAGQPNNVDPPDFLDIAVDSSGAKRLSWLDNTLMGTTWGGMRTGNGTAGTAQMYIEMLGTAGTTAENHGDGLDEYVGQFQNGRITPVTLSTGLANFVTYYDAWAHSLKYAITRNNAALIRTTQPATGNTLIAGGDWTVPAQGNPAYTLDAGSWSTNAMDNIGEAANTVYPVVMYYDATNQKLRLARSTVNIYAGAYPTSTANWESQDVITSGTYMTGSGQYVSMAIEAGTGNIHAVCYNSEEGVLLYLHAAGINGAGGVANHYTFDAPVVIDATTGVGNYADIALVGTLPYVSYIYSALADTNRGLKHAYKSGSSWEYGIVPCTQSVRNARTSIAAVQVTTTAPSWGRRNVAGTATVNVAIAFAGQKFYYMVQRPEN
jgi:hypothetical protein